MQDPGDVVREDLVRDLLDGATRAALHRLGGVRALLSGWASLGLKADQEPLLRERLQEDRTLLSRLDWIRGVLHAGPRRHVLLHGEAPRVMLAAGLGYGTPEEAGERVPSIHKPIAGYALALWAQAVAGENGGGRNAPLPVAVGEDGLTAEAPSGAPPLPEELLDPFRELFAGQFHGVYPV